MGKIREYILPQAYRICFARVHDLHDRRAGK
jgi:hypothetical protein